MTPCFGGYTFAEDPCVAAPDARIIWHAAFDPGTLHVSVQPTTADDEDGIDPNWIKSWLTLVDDIDGQHAVLSDGCHHIRIDIDDGKLICGQHVVLHYRLYGIASASNRVLPLQRLLRLVRDRRFPVSLFRAETVGPRDIALLRVRDALNDRASLREMSRALFGDENVIADRQRGSDSLRSRIRRLVADARLLAAGGYRQLMHRRSGRLQVRSRAADDSERSRG